MIWNYRVMRHTEAGGDVWYAIHEVYYDDNRRIEVRTDSPRYPYGDTAGELRENLNQMLEALGAPVLDYTDDDDDLDQGGTG